MKRARLVHLLLAAGIVVYLAASLPLAVRAADVEGAFGVDDYFRLQKITQVALSPDGTTVAYVVRAGAILPYYSDQLPAEEKRSVSTVYLQPIADGKPAVAADLINDAQGLVWLPGSRELAFVASRAGSPQVFTYDTRTREVRQRTRSSDGVESFRFAADGKTLAYVTRASTPPSKNLYSRLQNGDHGIVIDSNTLSVYDFVDPTNDVARRPLPAVLHVLPAAGEPFDVPVPGEPGSGIGSYHWSSDGRFLSVTYIAQDIRPSLLGSSRTSLGVFALARHGFRVLGKAIEPQPPRAGTRYEGGEWVPGQDKLLVRRVTESDPWVSPSYPDWAVADATSGLAGVPWHPVSVYGEGAAFLPMGPAGILLEDTREGVHSIFRLSGNGVERSKFVSGLDGSSSLARFSDDFSTAVFVNESLTRPPELYVVQGASPARRVTALNLEIARGVRHTAREVTWKSTDGVTVHGWLLEPTGAGKGPWPMITHVHGGPGFAFPDSFAPYFEVWPYPLEVLAARGFAILLPNYRGTESYGRAFASPRRLDGEPVDDVITGVKEMIENGVADPARLGISGHSHGAWLGPLVMARAKLFRAGSFAEGSGNEVLLYSLMPGDLNRQVHDVMNGVSFWDDPRPYLEASPDMSFKGVHTASLWEAGAQSAALLMFGYPKAARHFGAPSEFIVYPKTGHNPNLPSVQRESANRNLDWFEFWLRGVERGAAEKPDQYTRWKEMQSGSLWANDYLRSR